LVAVAILVASAVIWWPRNDGGAAPPPLRKDAVDSLGKEDPPRRDPEPGPEPRPPLPPAEGGRQEAATPDLRASVVEEIRAVEASDDVDALRKLCGRHAVDDRLPADFRELLRQKTEQLNRRLVFSRTDTPGFDRVKVQPGDSYWKISRRLVKERGLSVPSGLLERINGIGAHRLRAGQTLKVPTEPLSVLVDKDECRLYLLLGGVYLLHFDIGVGRDDLTPEGDFEIRGKTRNPKWTDPETGKVRAYGDPGHIIGSRWLGLHQAGGPTGFGIHGTVEPDTVGRAVSEGCIRLRNDEVEELFELVSEGTPVTVRH
jgi:lipoprotein-anchoring transpeptidase ErfK/SrfK